MQDVVVKTENGVHTILLTAEDPVLRGHLQLTKYVSDDGTAGGDNRKALQVLRSACIVRVKTVQLTSS